jgi:hypothetical protein
MQSLKEILPEIIQAVDNYQQFKHLYSKEEVQEHRDSFSHLSLLLADSLGDSFERLNKTEFERKTKEREYWLSLKKDSSIKMTDKERDLESYIHVKDLLEKETEFTSECKRASLVLNELQHTIHSIGSRLKTLSETTQG